ncbi:MAG: 3-phosphoshikimate 1-carboxyvinyltransferase, partial [Bacillota bacterium]
MNITILTPPRGGSIAAIASKSHAHRALIAAALADAKTELVCGETNEDILATVRCLRALGAQIAYDHGIFTVLPIPGPAGAEKRTLDCGESGSTLRFLLPVACALHANVFFAMHARLPMRPLSPLYEELVSHGCQLSRQSVTPLDVTGKLTGGVYTIAGSVSSQFITGLLLALPLVKEDSRIDVTGELESRPYVDITLQTLKDFGIEVTQRGGSFFIRGSQRFASPGTLTVEGDWSNAACWLALGAISDHPVTVTGLNLRSPQGDKAFLDMLKRFGAKVVMDGSGVTVSGGDLRGIDADVRANPDLAPMIAAVALAARGQTRIQNAARLRLKECDRLSVINGTLRAFGAQITETPDGLIIGGGHPLHGAAVSSEDDHRIVMMAAVTSALCAGEVTVAHADAVHKS